MNHNFLYTSPPLFLKPLYQPDLILSSQFFTDLGHTISFRSFDLEKDVDRVYDWVNREYALRYWQLNGTRQRVWDTYYAIQRNGHGHSYIGLLNSEPSCQFDVYRLLADELGQILSPDENDCGFHLLMAPNEKSIPNLSLAITRAFLNYYFSFEQAERMYAEPDVHNLRSNALLRRAGFHYLNGIRMSYKTANLYCITKKQFHETHSIG